MKSVEKQMFALILLLACYGSAVFAGPRLLKDINSGSTWSNSGEVNTEIIDSTSNGMGNALDYPLGIAVDNSGNAYVTGDYSDNAFKITPVGVITEIIDSTGDGMGNALDYPRGIAVDDSGNAYVTGSVSDNAFKITPDGVITEIIDSTGHVNYHDFAALAFEWLEVDCSEPYWCGRVDIDFSGDVGFLDLQILIENWLEGI